MSTKPTHPKWIPDGNSAYLTNPGEAKRALGFIYTEKPAFQHYNWSLFNFSEWIKGLQGGFFDIIVGSSTQVTDFEATHEIDDLDNALVVAGSKVLFLDGTHTLTADLALSNADIILLSESPAAIITVSTFQILMTGARQMLNLRITGAGANDVQLSGAGSHFEGIDLDIANVQVSGGATAKTSGIGGGVKGITAINDGVDVTNYLKGHTAYLEDDVGADSTGFNVSGFVGAAWESLGPTGSGATNIWTALDSVPVGAKWVEIKLSHSCTDNGGVSFNQFLYARVTGSGSGISISNQISKVGMRADGAGIISNSIQTTAKIPVDSSGRFDLYFVADGSSRSADMYLVGFGI